MSVHEIYFREIWIHIFSFDNGRFALLNCNYFNRDIHGFLISKLIGPKMFTRIVSAAVKICWSWLETTQCFLALNRLVLHFNVKVMFGFEISWGVLLYYIVCRQVCIFVICLNIFIMSCILLILVGELDFLLFWHPGK